MITAKEFESALRLTCLVPSSRTEWDIRTPDLNRPGMQFCGFYEFFGSLYDHLSESDSPAGFAGRSPDA